MVRFGVHVEGRTDVLTYMDVREGVIKDGSEILVPNKWLNIGTFAEIEDDLEDELVETGKEYRMEIKINREIFC